MTSPDGDYKHKSHEPRLDSEKELSGDASNEASDSGPETYPERVPVLKRHHPIPGRANADKQRHGASTDPRVPQTDGVKDPRSQKDSEDSNSAAETRDSLKVSNNHKAQPKDSHAKDRVSDDSNTNGSKTSQTLPLSHHVDPQLVPSADVDPVNLDPVRVAPLPSESVASGKSDPSTDDLKRFFCRICNQGFSRKHNMVSHELIHLSTKPHVCRLCNATFRRIHDLRRHEKLHLGEKPFHCPYCRRGFARTDALTRHSNSMNACSLRPPEEGKQTGASTEAGATDLAVSAKSPKKSSVRLSLGKSASLSLNKSSASLSIEKSSAGLSLEKSSAGLSVKKPSLEKSSREKYSALTSAKLERATFKASVKTTEKPSRGENHRAPKKTTNVASTSSADSSGTTPHMEGARGLSVSNPVSASSSDESRNNLVDSVKSTSYDVNRWRAMQQQETYSAVNNGGLPNLNALSATPQFSRQDQSQATPLVMSMSGQLPSNVPVSREYHHHFYHHHHDRGFIPNNNGDDHAKDFSRDFRPEDRNVLMPYNQAHNRQLPFPPMDGRPGQYQTPMYFRDNQYWIPMEQERPHHKKNGSMGSANFSAFNNPTSSGSRAHGGTGEHGDPRHSRSVSYVEPSQPGYNVHLRIPGRNVHHGNAGNAGNAGNPGNLEMSGNGGYPRNPGNPGSASNFGFPEYSPNPGPGNRGNPNNPVTYSSQGNQAEFIRPAQGDPLETRNRITYESTNSGESAPSNNSADSSNLNEASKWGKDDEGKDKPGRTPRGFVTMSSYNQLVNYTHSLQNSLSTMEDRILALEKDGRKDEQDLDEPPQKRPPQT